MMKTVSELTDFYYKELFTVLKDLDDERKGLRYRLIIIFIIYTLFFFIIYLNLQEFIGFIVVIYIALGAFIYKYLTKDYVKNFKEQIIKPLIENIDKNLNYSENLHVSEYIFNRSNLFTTPDKLSGNDYVHGIIDGTKIEFSDIYAQKRRRDSKGHTHWETIFRGLFISAEFNKNFKGSTVILPDVAQNTFGDVIGSMLQSYNLGRDELVKMDSVEFEREFVVYGTDQIEARYILSNSLMEKLLNYVKRSKHKIHISFVGNHIHLAISYNKDMFEPTIFTSLLEYKVAIEYLNTLHLAIGIVDELKLNQKIWSKI